MICLMHAATPPTQIIFTWFKSNRCWLPKLKAAEKVEKKQSRTVSSGMSSSSVMVLSWRRVQIYVA